ncbi:MFS transporter [Clostridium minihomine]|uniref:MFS transporter n=1 Tax=Clostridium minihomine TaxID=2045012 RepID=UPI000C76E35A|nr:MFS transporter [Clostridium minihomine]
MEQQKTPLWTKDFIIISILNLLLFCGFQMLLPTLPIHAKSLGGSNTMLGWIIGASTVASLLIRPVSGMLLDKMGRKGILIGGLCILILVTLSYGWLPSLGAIIAVRFLHGLGWGMASTASSTIASDQIPKHRFGEGMGFFSLSSSLAIALAPSIGLGVLAAYGFNPLTFLSAGFTIAVLLLSIFIKSTEKAPQNTKNVKLAPYERASVFPSVIMFFASATYGSLTGFLSLYAAEKNIANIGMFFTVYAAFLLLSRPIYGKLTDRFGFNVIVFPGLLLLMVAMFFLSKSNTLVMFLISAAIYGTGFSAVQSSFQTMAIMRAPKERLGAANATFFTGFDGGIGFGSVIGGIIAASAGYSRMYLSFSIFIVIAAILYFVGFIKDNKLTQA